MDWYRFFNSILFVFFAFGYIWDILKINLDKNRSGSKKKPHSFWMMPVSKKGFFVYILGAAVSAAVAFFIIDPGELKTQDFYLPSLFFLMGLWLLVQSSKRYREDSLSGKIVSYTTLFIMMFVFFLGLISVLDVYEFIRYDILGTIF